MNNNNRDDDDDDDMDDGMALGEFLAAEPINNNNNNDPALPQQPAGNNVEEVEDDQDNDPDDDDDDDDPDDDDADGIDRDADGVLDGGVADLVAANAADDLSTAAPRRRAADCDLILFIACAETMDDLSPNHPVLKEGMVVSIGLDKNTKLGCVFKRYTEFCNEHAKATASASASAAPDNSSTDNNKIDDSDLEFFHCQLLSPTDTAENAALMKNDRIQVRRERVADRKTQTELKRIQRESDREYYKQLRHLLPDWGGSKYCDLILDCQGTIADEIGRNQQVLSTTVRGHSVVLGQRCQWLGSLITTAREKRDKQRAIRMMSQSVDEALNGDGSGSGSEVNKNDTASDKANDECESPLSEVLDVPEGNIIVANHSSTLPDDNDVDNENDDGVVQAGRSAVNRRSEMEEDDDDIGVMAYPVAQNQQQRQGDVQRSGATEIEDDDDNDENGDNNDNNSIGPSDAKRRRKYPAPVAAAAAVPKLKAAVVDNDYLQVTLPNHPPEAVKLLLEYCYTNRVITLGYEAFFKACQSKPVKPNGPVSPYPSSRRWPNGGLPSVAFSVAVAGIALAEEAGLPRMSLMCEVAASQLVAATGSNVTEALTMCTQQNRLTGNPLVRLREVAIGVVLRVGPRGIYDTPAFRRALEERSTSIIPTLMSGTMEAVEKDKKQHEQDASRMTLRAKLLATRQRNFSAITESHFNELDREERWKREGERKRRRKERQLKNPELKAAAGHLVNQDDEEGDVYCDQALSGSWAAESARRSLKRMAPHLNVSSFHVGQGGVYAPRETFGTNRVGYGMARKRSSRRRSSGRS